MKLSAILEFIIRRITDVQFSPFANGSSFSKKDLSDDEIKEIITLTHHLEEKWIIIQNMSCNSK